MKRTKKKRQNHFTVLFYNGCYTFSSNGVYCLYLYVYRFSFNWEVGVCTQFEGWGWLYSYNGICFIIFIIGLEVTRVLFYIEDLMALKL